MRPDFLLHLSASLALLFMFKHLFKSWRKAIMATLALQVGKELYDYFFKNGDVDLMDFAGDATAYVAMFIIHRMRF